MLILRSAKLLKTEIHEVILSSKRHIKRLSYDLLNIVV